MHGDLDTVRNQMNKALCYALVWLCGTLAVVTIASLVVVGAAYTVSGVQLVAQPAEFVVFAVSVALVSSFVVFAAMDDSWSL